MHRVKEPITNHYEEIELGIDKSDYKPFSSFSSAPIPSRLDEVTYQYLNYQFNEK